MKAMRLADSGATAVLVEENVPQPQPGRGELLIQVHAAGVTPTELLWYTTTHNKNGERRSRAVPGHEFSGVIAAVGEDTAGFAISDEVSQLGAERVIDYRAVRFEESVSGMDVVFDTVGGETLKRSWAVLKPGGRMITIAADSETTTDNRVKQAFFIVEPNHEQLIHIGDLLESSDLHPVVDAVLPLTRASAAYTGEVRERRGRGKLVVEVAQISSPA